MFNALLWRVDEVMVVKTLLNPGDKVHSVYIAIHGVS
jgi:hypothetical protein